ncbi:MAG TPA: diacylglycerol kinase family protein [Methylobacterium sp.]|jgi:diacylglycerol kinase family enzyme|uniref:diacylglycerol/lipid kinase family protein n=1 Tax=Methylorubrum sp. B1-46 TaxID=2897334 RepID=UPI001E290987|nr:diacylglycerol kinase family protein [Methylorubrum sp. B1-46]UGB25627.1 diacylglycerol kinase [Methylorubrum sp. B1-46]HEV2545180.1 diacylglycerol kinase family protein [Methylobacterium sp.]
MRIVLVANPASGAFAAGVTPDAIRARLRGAGLDLAPEPDETLPLPDRLRAALHTEGVTAVAVAGGDGTLNGAAGVLAGSGVALGILPFGTMNLLAKDLGIPLDLDRAIAVLAAGQTRAIDLGCVNGHLFLINSVLGMPARMVRHREIFRGRRLGLPALLRLAVATLRHLGPYPRLAAVISEGGRRTRLRLRMLAVVNNDYAEGPGKILERSQVDGGELTLYIARRLSPWRLVRLALGFGLGRWRDGPGLERRSATRFAVSARRRALRVMNDGEVRLIAPPLRYRLMPRALTVIVPEPKR